MITIAEVARFKSLWGLQHVYVDDVISGFLVIEHSSTARDSRLGGYLTEVAQLCLSSAYRGDLSISIFDNVHGPCIGRKLRILN